MSNNDWNDGGQKPERSATGETIKTLGEALPEEIRRVRDEILPEYVAIGEPGLFAATMMRADLDRASKAMIEGDTVAMLRFYESLKGYGL